MAWNEPGNNGNGNDKDPWGGGRKGGDQGPPDIDEVIKNLTKKFGGIFGANKGGSSSGSGKPSGDINLGLIAGLVVAVVVVWSFTGFYTVNQAERGVVLRFGKVLDAVVQPGLHWNPPLVDEVTLVNVQELNTRRYSNDMLTTDENILNFAVAVQYVIADPVNYVISVQNPELSLDNASESAIRHVVGGNYMDQILTTGRSVMADDIKQRLQGYMDLYTTGILVSQVNVVDAQPPEDVRPAFDDVIRAREDEQKVQNEAERYANQIIPEAGGLAQQTIEQANAYKQEVIARAEGDASRFDQLLAEYLKAPEVTRQRLYLDSIEEVMISSSKIMIDVEGGNNMLYIPLDKILESSGPTLGADASRADLRALANELAPFLPNTGSTNLVNSTRLSTTGRGGR
ncbi:MAG: FtsH protease activity modulator HflK [SAR86 cluster bacterium]|uniref:Protein HflK n=1 Tax=SAR86 cluster bacterium TaxID=2030880 RepID=A0A2A4MIH5_9GAMM|nr:MAG: FtsH protease activity modulator HflK [SAR86 cluster bacterium]